MPSGVSIASADQNLARAIEELNRESAEARDHLAATSEILGIISAIRSPHRRGQASTAAKLGRGLWRFSGLR